MYLHVTKTVLERWQDAKKVFNSMADYQILHNCILHLAQILYPSFFASVAPQPPHVAVGDPLKLKCGFQEERWADQQMV